MKTRTQISLFQHIRVLELARKWRGPAAGRTLASACVLQIQCQTHGACLPHTDAWRLWHPRTLGAEIW